MEEIKEALQPVMVELMKLIAVIISVLLVNILTILRNSVKERFVKKRILSWAVAKAIKMEGKEFEKFTNTQKWLRLVEHAEKVGITEAELKRFEADIMGAVENWKNEQKLFGGVE